METIRTQSNKILKKILLETGQDDRSFLLLHGDLLQDEGDVIIITIHDNADQSQGELYEAVKQKYGIDLWEERRIYFLEGGGWIGEVKIDNEDSHHKPIILTLHTGLPEGTVFEIETYEKYVKGTFAALAALEFEGVNFRDVALPVLIRKGLENNYEEAIQLLIKYATSWLKKSLHLKTIKYYIYHSEDAVKWDSAMEKVLSRTYVSYQKAGIIQQLRREIIMVIDTFKKEKDLDYDLLWSLRESISRNSEGISKEVGINARTLAEVIVKNLCEKEPSIGRRPKEDLSRTIQFLKEEKIISELLSQYLHSLRSFGNFMAHMDRNSEYKYSISHIQEDDKLFFMTTLLRTLRYYARILKD
ncbi:hypothetical protein AAB109_05830 [Priestia megaterium]|uniref:DUF4145 domain-containing protein n=1 Tax=Priestia megaterium TaxID=1404 RepID=UPI002ACEBA32|nr:hypothetical protein [Priestia megaterium]